MSPFLQLLNKSYTSIIAAVFSVLCNALRRPVYRTGEWWFAVASEFCSVNAEKVVTVVFCWQAVRGPRCFGRRGPAVTWHQRTLHKRKGITAKTAAICYSLSALLNPFFLLVSHMNRNLLKVLQWADNPNRRGITWTSRNPCSRYKSWISELTPLTWTVHVMPSRRSFMCDLNKW